MSLEETATATAIITVVSKSKTEMKKGKQK